MKNAVVFAMLTLVALSHQTAAQTKKFHSGSSSSSKSSSGYHPSKSADDEKKMPRSTAPANVHAKPGTAQQNELSRIEHQSSRHLQTQSKHKTGTQGGHLQPEHSKAESHGSDIRFSHHEPRGSGSKSTSGNGTKRKR